MLMPIQESTSSKTMFKQRNNNKNYHSIIQLKKKITARRLPLKMKTRIMAMAMSEAKVMMVRDKIVWEAKAGMAL